ncbi:ORF1087 [White spot syndrome virus]|uniref:Wsv202 n=3 Tax=White spot syndrome virus TaxID=342409 RepID=Q8VB08_WSSVS|nr:wsv202 [Shrimp white spot syndrome virus]AFX59579.1 wsv202 [White spot syndrome virus]AAL33206.1 wsv202 [Shrimp white spot syndrome virus]AAL89125.1 WSSV257 [Shrimp white spot syndrome virus]ATU84199.1 ORF1087 [White spot syndrome virus]AWQ60376.1 wsv202 [Shrimp white spot syndrome virus]
MQLIPLGPLRGQTLVSLASLKNRNGPLFWACKDRQKAERVQYSPSPRRSLKVLYYPSFFLH